MTKPQRDKLWHYHMWKHCSERATHVMNQRARKGLDKFHDTLLNVVSPRIDIFNRYYKPLHEDGIV